jgi:NTP pyrophosphatase (non-canonical NTP hydrolase)
MTLSEYQSAVLRTENSDFNSIRGRLDSDRALRLIHGVMGVQTEAGELADTLKKATFYGRPFDRINILEEVGDVLWYLTVICDAAGSSLEIVMNKNIAKLRGRYGDQFSEEKAVNRRLDIEREVLEDDKQKF